MFWRLSILAFGASAASPTTSGPLERSRARALPGSAGGPLERAAARQRQHGGYRNLDQPAGSAPSGERRWAGPPLRRGTGEPRAPGTHGPGGDARADHRARGHRAPQGPNRGRRTSRGTRSCPRRSPLMTAPIRVLVADDHMIVRTGIRHVLESEAGFEVVGEAATGAEALALAAKLKPDVVVLDISMPGESGLQLAARLRDSSPEPRVLILSMHDNAEYV